MKVSRIMAAFLILSLFVLVVWMPYDWFTRFGEHNSFTFFLSGVSVSVGFAGIVGFIAIERL